MCVIAYKAKNVRFPSKERIAKMWDTNPDGAGVMWRDPDTNKIKFVKGFMKLNKLNHWSKRNMHWLQEVECALHFRITTHGGTCKENCHPFICDCDVDPHLLRGEADYVLMHNGVLSITPRRKDISDSAELALRIGQYANPTDVMDVFGEQCSGNRIIIMGPSGTKFYGDKFVSVDGDGILYSNDYFNMSKFYYYNFMRPAAKSSSTINEKGLVYFDKNRFQFVNKLTGNAMAFEDVDPDMLSRDDYEIYTDMMISYDNIYNDAEVAEMADYYGMTEDEYKDYCKQ